MAIRRDELVEAPEAVIVLFPTRLVRARAARRRAEMARSRLALVASGLVLAGALLLGAAGDPVVASLPGAPDAVVLRPGQTLWDLAERYAPDGADPRAYVHELEELNDLAGPVPAGMALDLPK